MKKSQVLTALTFAFALGVVAPVVSLYVDGQSTYAVAEDESATISDAIARAMQTATNGVTATSYKTLQTAVTKAEAADAEVANEMVDTVTTRFDTDSREDYEGKTANEVLALVAEKHPGMSLTVLENKMKPLETNIEEITDCLKDDFGQDVEDIDNLDAAIEAAKGVEKYSLYTTLLAAVSEAEAVDEDDADAVAAAIAKIDAAVTGITGESNTGEDDPSTDPGDDEGEGGGEGEGEGDDDPADTDKPAADDGKGEEAAAPEKGGSTPNTGVTGTASGTATAVSASSAIATIATGIFAVMRHLRQGKEA